MPNLASALLACPWSVDSPYHGLPTIVIDCSVCGDMSFSMLYFWECQEGNQFALVRKDLAEVVATAVFTSSIKGVLEIVPLQSLAHLLANELVDLPKVNDCVALAEQRRQKGCQHQPCISGMHIEQLPKLDSIGSYGARCPIDD